MKKIHWFTFNATEVDDSSNRAKLSGSYKPVLEVSIVDKNGHEIKRNADVLMNEHKVLITMKFQWEISNYVDTSLNNIEYFIKKTDDCWEVDKENKDIITIKPGKKAEFEEALKEIHKNLFEGEFEDKINVEKHELKGGTDMKYIILKDRREGYKVSIYRGDENDNRVFPWEQVEIEPKFFQNKEVGFDNIATVKYQEEEKKSQWTNGWIALFVILSIIIILGIAFRKKLWRWIKGEREQEKKVREQIDIF